MSLAARIVIALVVLALLVAALYLAYLAVFMEGESDDGTVVRVAAGLALTMCFGAVTFAVRK
jgi:hypothetical protein